MYRQTIYRAPINTPRGVQFLMGCIFFCSLFWAVCKEFFPIFSSHYLVELFALTPHCLSRGYLWQLVLYGFVQPLWGQMSLHYLIDLAFKLYLVWSIGCSLCELRGERSLLAFYFSGTAICGTLHASLLYFIPHSLPFMGAHSSVYILLFAWMMLNPYGKIYLFFSIPLNTVLLIVGFWICHLFLSLIQGDFSSLFAYFSAGAYGYLYTVCCYKVLSPFPKLYSFERRAQEVVDLLWRPKKGKVYDFQTGKELSKDELFMDTMLAKIAEFGEQSLTKQERRRMKEISKRSFPH